MTEQQKKWLLSSIGVLVLASLAIVLWQSYVANRLDENIMSGNGRIEATEIDVSARIAGRVEEILVREGDFVKAGQVVAYMDTEVLVAQLKEAQAQLLQAKSSVVTAHSQLEQRRSEKLAALAVVKQREAELEVSNKRLARSLKLVREKAVSLQQAEDDQARLQSAVAAVDAAQAQVSAAEAAIETAREQISGAEAAVKAAEATVQRIEADIEDSALISPRDGRVQYRIAQPGEVVGAGGRVLSLIDLSDVYMTFFLPTAIVGRIEIGAEVKLVLDVAPNYIVPAKVSFISDEAQFTPKTVETASEREKLMFRVRAQIPVELLQKHITQVKTGLPGMAYIRLDSSKPWPKFLQVRN